MGAYLGKMAIDGYIINTDTPPIRQVYKEMHNIGVNVNQIFHKLPKYLFVSTQKE